MVEAQSSREWSEGVPRSFSAGVGLRPRRGIDSSASRGKACESGLRGVWVCRHASGCQRFTSLGQLSPQIRDLLVSSAEAARWTVQLCVFEPSRSKARPHTQRASAVWLPCPSVEGLLPHSSLGLLEEHLEERREGEII